MQIFCAELEHRRVLAEYPDPLLRKGSRGQSDQFGECAGHQYTNPRRLYGSFCLAGAEVCGGLELGVDVDQKLIGGRRYRDKRPVAIKMWAVIMGVLRDLGAIPEAAAE